MNSDWYKDAVIYQIWPRSFCDGNGDGIGDLYGVYSKLDYIKSLGVDAIWFSPLYPSPNEDFGYDVSDYRDINPEYGDLDIFKRVLEGAHERGLRVIMDLVINHTSTEHEWFRLSREKGDPHHDYYFWRPPRRGHNGARKEPSNWDSLFGGEAWEYDEQLGEYYLHIFAKGQADLNHDNPAVRAEIADIMRFWLDMGVDGFREDAVVYISKEPGLPDQFPRRPAANGLKKYCGGPRLHDYLRFYRSAVADYDCLVIGEADNIPLREAAGFMESGELDMMLTFDHMRADCVGTDFIRRGFSVKKFKRALSAWQTGLAGRGWNALYLENHDHARVISRYGSEEYRVESGKALAASYMLLSGTPFVYQGQEIGMTNLRLPRADMYPDVMTRGQVRLASRWLPEKAVLRLAQDSARESSRTPMQWTAGKNAGFTEGTPWFYVNENFRSVNVEAAEADENSLLNFYRELIAFRKREPAVRYGSYTELIPQSPNFYCYVREYENRRLLVIASLVPRETYFTCPEGFSLLDGELVLKNHELNVVVNNAFTARPYELRVYLFE